MFRFIAILFGLALVYYIRDIMASLLFAVVVASAIEPAIAWLRERKVPRIIGVILIYFTFAATIFFSVYLVFPLFFEEFQGFSATYPAIAERVLSGIERAETLPFTSLLTENVEDLIRLPSEYLVKFSGGIVNFAATVFGGVFSFVRLRKI